MAKQPDLSGALLRKFTENADGERAMWLVFVEDAAQDLYRVVVQVGRQRSESIGHLQPCDTVPGIAHVIYSTPALPLTARETLEIWGKEASLSSGGQLRLWSEEYVQRDVEVGLF